MAHRQQQKKRKKKKKCRKNKVRNNQKKAGRQQAVIHPQRQAQKEEEKENRNGLIEWRVTGNLLRQLKNAKQGQSFESPQFKTIDGTSWRIIVYPHGIIKLECVQLRDNKQPIGVNFSFNIMELDWTNDGWADTFKSNGYAICEKVFTRNQLTNVKSLTLKCVVGETMDVSE
eukprot:113759_1